MAAVAPKTKITETFTITSRGGESYSINEHTRWTSVKTDGVKREELGRKFFKTDDGRGVLKNADDNTYAIPSLGVKSASRALEAK